MYRSRRSQNSRRPMRKRRYRRGGRKPMTVGKVKRIISAELKLTVVSNDFIPIDVATPMVIPLTNNIAQGDTNLNRTGNWIQPITYHGYCSVRGIQASPEISNNVRIIILRWKNDESMDPALLNKVVFGPADPQGSFNFVNKGSFTVLYSRVFNIVHQERNPQFLKQYRWKVSLGRGQKVLYDTETPKKYQLFFMAFSDALNPLNAPQLQLSSTLRWTDS